MELRHLRYFLAVAESENVRIASERLNVTQPAVSRQIQDLEDELGVKLFERLPRGLRLSREGMAYRADVLAIMAALAAARNRARGIAAGELGLLKIGFIEVSAWRGVVPEAFHAFRLASPAVRLELAPMGSPEQLKLILDGALDGGFVYLFENLPEGLLAMPLQTHNVILAMPANRKGLRGGRVLLRDLGGVPFVSFYRSAYPAYYDQLFAACAAGGLAPTVVQEGQNEAAVLSLVSAGIGVAIVNDSNCNRPPVQVDFARIDDLSVPLPLSFVYRKDQTNPALPQFISRLSSLGASTQDPPAISDSRKADTVKKRGAI